MRSRLSLSVPSLVMLLVILPFLDRGVVVAQSTEQVKQQAESQLRQMTPEQIDARIKALGLTREEASRRAAELGISLEQYLGRTQTPPAAPATPLPGPVAPVPSLPAAPPQQAPTPAPPPTSPSGLPYFGYDVFSTVPAAFEPAATGPADPQYLVGPGDVLRVSVWGQVEFQNELTVDPEGRIFIPTVGQVLLSGLTLERAYDKLLKQMSRSYSGLVAKNPTVWMDVTIARLRPKRVFMMGEVQKPGGYTVSSHSTVFNTLYAVGGPTVEGSLREVRVIRDDKMIAQVDLYDYLRGAEKTNDIRVQNNDIVFVPVRGKTVSIRGAVVRPAVYELKEGENLRTLLDICGGVKTSAYGPNAQIERIRPIERRAAGVDDRIVVDVDLGEILAGRGKDLALYPGDDITVFSILDEKYNYVTVTGSVWRPGRFELGAIQTVQDLLQAAKGVQPKTYTELAHLVRYNEDLITKRIIPLYLKRILEDSEYRLRLMPRDELIIYSTEMVQVKDRFVTVRGEVKRPGQYPLRDNMTLEDLIPLAGGYTEAAERLKAEVSRIVPQGVQGDSLVILLHPHLPQTFTVPEGVNGTDPITADQVVAQGRFLLYHRDEILVVPNPEYVLQKPVGVEGDVLYPGTYSISLRGERLSEMFARAGGATKTSYLGGAELYRGGRRVLIDIEKAVADRGGEHDIELQTGDRIVVPSRPRTVNVTGEVNRPGLLVFLEGDDVSDYVDRAGGVTDSADYAVVTQPTGESRRVDFGWFRADPEVYEGATIEVKKVPPPPPPLPGEPLATTIKDVFAIVASAATIWLVIYTTTK